MPHYPQSPRGGGGGLLGSGSNNNNNVAPGRNLLTSSRFSTVENEDHGHDDTVHTSFIRRSAEDIVTWFREPRRRSVGAVLFASFLSLLGFTMAGPLTPALGRHFQLEVGGLFGALTSAYPLGMLLGISFWPSLSDKIGRRPVLSLSLLGSGIGLLAQGYVIKYGGTLPQFLFCRVATGLFSGSSAISKAYLADIGTRDGKLPRYLALKDAASTMAFILGPAIGGLLYDLRRRMIGATRELSHSEVLNTSGSLAFVIAVSAVASMVASLITGLFVQESSKLMAAKKKSAAAATAAAGTGTALTNDSSMKADVQDDEKEDDSDVEAEQIISCPLGQSLWAGVASICVVSFLFNIGDSTFHAFYSAFLRDQGISTGDIGLLFTCLACFSFTVSSTSASAILKRLGPVLSCASGLALVGSGLLTLGVVASGSSLLPPTRAVLAMAAALYYCGVPVFGPTIPTMLLRCVPANKRGFILGLDGSINTLARIITPIAMGEVYRRYQAGTAFAAAGIAVISGACITILRRYTVSKDLRA